MTFSSNVWLEQLAEAEAEAEADADAKAKVRSWLLLQFRLTERQRPD